MTKSIYDEYQIAAPAPGKPEAKPAPETRSKRTSSKPGTSSRQNRLPAPAAKPAPTRSKTGTSSCTSTSTGAKPAQAPASAQMHQFLLLKKRYLI